MIAAGLGMRALQIVSSKFYSLFEQTASGRLILIIAGFVVIMKGIARYITDEDL